MITLPPSGAHGKLASRLGLALALCPLVGAVQVPRSDLRDGEEPARVALAPSPAPAPAGGEHASGSAPVRDNLKGRWHNFNVAPIEPFAFEPDGSICYAINAPGTRLAVLSVPDLETQLEVPTGPGLATVRARPGTPELWCADSLTSAITVIDRTSGVHTRTIQVGAEPHGIVFTASGDRAYVTCSQDDQVDVIQTSTYSVVHSISIPARLPRGIARIGDTVYVVPLRSGNGSAPRGNPVTGDANDVRTVAKPAEVSGAVALPDRDLFAIPITASPTTDALDPSATVSGLGTTLYNLHVRPGTSELWIPHTDALNAERRGERNFIDGQVVRNRIAVVDTADSSVRTIELDDLAPTIDLRIGTPTGIAFTADGDRAFVCGFGSSRVGVLDLDGDSVSWAGVIHVSSMRPSPGIASNPAHAGAGPRCAEIEPGGRHLLIHNTGENSLSRVDLTGLPQSTPFEVETPSRRWLGWDPTPLVMVQGRIDLNRTDNSRSRTSSCASCHIDGHLDGLVWDLSVFLDPEGTPSDELHFPLDDKGPLVTQSLRRLRETAPYHWRGERRKLRNFDAAFIGLLRREVNGELKGLGPNFNYLRRYMEFLALRPNPAQREDRGLRPLEQQGLEVFSTKPVLDGLRCIDCHALPLGTSGALIENGRPGMAPTTVVPTLRGINDKEGRAHFAGELFGRRNELGAGLGHDGAFGTLERFLTQDRPAPHGGQRFDLTAREVTQLASFLRAFDTGLAPSTMKQLTLRTASVTPELTDLLEQAELGHCDVVYRRGPVQAGGDVRYETGLYDPATQTFRRASQSLQPRTLGELLAYAPATPITFLGTPLWSGVPMALDRDNDGLLDLDEAPRGTHHENTDTDGDGFPDGYELNWGMDPTVEDLTSPDQVAPDWVAPPTVLYVTQNTVKFEFLTDEPARITVFLDGGIGVERWPLKPHFDTAFSLAIGGLNPGTTHELSLDIIDPAGNVRTRSFDVTTLWRATPAPVGVESITLNVRTNATGSQQSLHASVKLAGASGPPPIGYNLVGALYHSSPQGVVEIADSAQTWLVFPDGTAHFYVPLPGGLPAGELYFTLRQVDAPPGAPFHAAGRDVAAWATLDY